MFSDDSERIIPKKRPNYGQILIQVFIVLIFLAYLAAPLLFYEQLNRYPQVENIWLPALFIGLLVVILAAAWLEGWTLRRNWAAFAEEMGFRYKPPERGSKPAIQGSYRSHRFEIIQTTVKRGRNQTHYTNFILPLNNTVSISLKIQPKRMTHFNRELTGDADIDRKLTFSTNSKKLIENLLRTRRIRLGMLQLRERNRRMQLGMDKTTLQLTLVGRISNREYLLAVLVYLAELASAIERFDQLGR